MRFIDSPETDIYFHLAAEEYLLKQGTEDVFMLWQDTASVVVGKHQRVQAEVNLEFVKERQISVARRFSGGGTVYHDSGNINLTFIETTKSAYFEKYLQGTKDFLASVGISAHSDQRMGIYIDGLKVSGSAQCIHKDRVMYHCTLLYDTDLQTLTSSLDASPVQPFNGYAVPSVRSEVTNISRHLSAPITVQEFRRRAFLFFASGQPKNSFSDEERQAILRLRNEKYLSEGWIYAK